MGDSWNSSSKGGSNQSVPDPERFSRLEDIDVPADGSPTLRIVISVVYSVVCAVGLVGNAMVFFLMKVRRGRKRSTINFYILNLAVTDFQFVLTLPFWAAENALDFSWPFGNAMCKIILSVTVMNVYASVFFLTAMSVARYWSVASALKDRSRVRACSVRWVCALLWASATAASVPTAVFATETRVFNDKLCLLKFPDQYLLALYHLHRILIAFVLPMCVVSVCYVMLLRLIRLRSMNNNHPKRRSRVTRSVAIVVLSFFICWLPNHAITFWSVLVKFNLAQWDEAYYAAHTYMFPVSACLAHTNSCLNPLLYCLMRSEIRKTIKSLCWRMSSPAGAPGGCQVRPFSGTRHADPDDTQAAIPLHTVDTENCGVSAATLLAAEQTREVSACVK